MHKKDSEPISTDFQEYGKEITTVKIGRDYFIINPFTLKSHTLFTTKKFHSAIRSQLLCFKEGLTTTQLNNWYRSFFKTVSFEMGVILSERHYRTERGNCIFSRTINPIGKLRMTQLTQKEYPSAFI